MEESVLRNILGVTDTILLIMDNTLDAPAPTYPEMDVLVADFLD